VDRATEKHLRNLESDLKTYEGVLKEAESRVERLISRVGTLRQQILKVSWFEANEEQRSALDKLLDAIDGGPEGWAEISSARDEIIRLQDEAEQAKLERK
jgi:hypothetical protein